jgi:hypothetical protein
MTVVIEFYIPARFRTHAKWIPPSQRGKLIEFPAKIEESGHVAGRVFWMEVS